MKSLLISILLVLSIHNCSGQIDTSTFKKQKGFLFLSSQHHIYDWPNGDEMREGFSDYFFPIDNFDLSLFSDSSKYASFKNGVRVEFFKTRQELKVKSKTFYCQKSNNCYKYGEFYIIPVTVDYKLFDDNWPLACRSEFFDIEIIKGKKIRFYQNHKAIVVSQISTN